MISHEYKCIFIYIPKTAGTSVEKRFGAHEKMDARLNQGQRTVRNIMSGIALFATANMSLRIIFVNINQRYQVVREGVNFVSKAQWDSYFKFCFVRTP